jgi:broad specificity phosphatase PhoE
LGRMVWLLRHGARADYWDGKWQSIDGGTRDASLSELGRAQAEELAKTMKNESIDHIFVSPYLRTLQTASPLCQALGMRMKVEDGIGECLWGLTAMPSELLSVEARQKLFPTIDPTYTSIKSPLLGPETGDAAEERAGQVILQLVDAYAGNLLFLGHGITVLGGARALVGAQNPLRAAFCSISSMEWVDSAWCLRRNGDISHLSNKDINLQHQMST